MNICASKKTKNVLFFHEISQATRAVKINA